MVAMNFQPMARAGWQLRKGWRMAWRRFGLMGVVLLSLLLMLIALALFAHRLESQREGVQQALAQEVAVERSSQPAPLAQDDRARLHAFYAGMPAQEDIPSVLQDMMDRAEASGLVLAKGQYQMQDDPGAGFSRYHMTLPVRGKGAVVRGFINQVLREHPYLALDSVQLSRKRIDAVVVEARVQWVLLVRASESKP